MKLFLNKPPECRWGQYLYNQLYAERPEIADLIRGTKDDPFNNDSNIPKFLAMVTELENDGERTLTLKKARKELLEELERVEDALSQGKRGN